MSIISIRFQSKKFLSLSALSVTSLAKPQWTLTMQQRWHSGDKSGPETLSIKWIHKDGRETITPAAVGASLLEVAHRHGIELEGACEGVCACSTCHVILQKDVYDTLPEPSEEEDDMLDRAFGLTATSRLGCQVKLEEAHNGLVVKLPKATRNFYVVSLKQLSASY